MTTVRDATAADLPALGRVLSAAFADDPVMAWLSGSDRRYARHAWRFFRDDAKGYLHKPGRLLVDADLGGAALWAAPGHWKQSLAHTAGMAGSAARLCGPRLPIALATLTAMEKQHPTDVPHWYLAVLGADPSRQGRGVGSALIREVTDRCDTEGVPAYLESSKAVNVPYYERHGFVVTGEHRFGTSGPTVWLMWRDPR